MISASETTGLDEVPDMLAMAPEHPSPAAGAAPAPPANAMPPQTQPSNTMRLVDDLEERFRAGDDDALRAAYDAHGSLVYTACARTVGESMAADVTQEVFLSAWRSHERFDSAQGSLAGWLVGIAKHRSIDALRAAGRRPALVGTEDEITSDESIHLTEGRVGQVVDRMLLAEALDELSPRARRAVELAYFEDLPHREVAAITGQPLGTVKSDLRRGLAHLRRHLEGSHA